MEDAGHGQVPLDVIVNRLLDDSLHGGVKRVVDGHHHGAAHDIERHDAPARILRACSPSLCRQFLLDDGLMRLRFLFGPWPEPGCGECVEARP